jgi:hypothetical protein
LKFKFLVLFNALLASNNFILAENQLSPMQLKGLKKNEVITYLGVPNRSSSVPSLNDIPSSETLYYGSSQITLINNKVTSIFDLGELKEILSKTKPISIVSPKKIWPNPWTPPDNLIK